MVIRRSLRAASVLLALLLALAAWAQKGADRYADVKVWYGSYSYRISGKEPQSEGSHELEAVFEGTFKLTQNAQQPNWYDGAIETSHASVRYKGVRKSNCIETTTLEASGPAVRPDSGGRDPDVRLHIWNDGWQVHQRKMMLKGALHRDGCGRSLTMDSFVAFPPDTELFPLPSSGSALDRKFMARGVVAAIPGGPFQHASWEGEVHLSPTRDELILEVASNDYDTWRPTAGAVAASPVLVSFADIPQRLSDASPGLQVSSAEGNSITFTATLKRKSGAPAGVDVSKMEWKLVNTSREPGIAMNFPVGAKDRDPDMMFDPQPGQVAQDKERQTLVTAAVKGATDTAKIGSYDWGGWATLRVVATLADGKEVVGKLQRTGEQDIAVPKRRKGSLIADAWRDKTLGADGGDSDDRESDTVHGNLHFGDGLTLYEEYRGFIVQGKHISGDPAKRELFVRNEVGARVEGGIAKFAKESGIPTHRLEANEFDAKTRLVNGNYRAGPHLVDQHGVLIVFDPTGESTRGPSFATSWIAGVPGDSPGQVEAILVPIPPLDPMPAAKDGTPYEAVSFAHELMHTVGVRHHGKGDYEAEWVVEAGVMKEYRLDAAGHRVGAGTPIRLIGSAGTDVTIAFGVGHPGGSKQLVGVDGGEGSGDDTCMMRYDRNSAYTRASSPGARMLIVAGKNDEPVGYRICTNPAGTGINAPPASNSRFGNAKAGNCFSQMRVSDRP